MYIIKQKLTAFTVHLIMSIAAITTVALFAKQYWYPGALFEIDGGFQGLTIVFWVDVVLGPILTFAVFRAGKKGLKIDLFLIAFLQLSCLIWGVIKTYEQRTLLVILEKDTFYTMSHNALIYHNISIEQINSLPGQYPKIFYIPDDTKEKSTLEKISELLNSGPSYTHIEKYQSIDLAKAYIDKHRLRNEKISKSTTHAPLNKGSMNDSTNLVHFNITGTFLTGIVEYDIALKRFVKFYPN